MNSEELAQAFGYLTLDEVTFIKELVDKLPEDPLIVNIGAGAGTSALAMLEERDDIYLMTIDLFQGPRPEGGLANEKVALEKAGINLDRYIQIKGDSLEVEWLLEDPIDCLFIDGNHSYNHVKTEIKLWMLHLNSDGIIALHDCKLPGDIEDVWPGVRQAVDELLTDEYPLIGYVDTLIAFSKRSE